MVLGIVIERRRIDHPWAEHRWRPVAVLPGAAEVADWRVLREGEDWSEIYAGGLPLDLFRKETVSYRYNLDLAEPKYSSCCAGPRTLNACGGRF
jgi:hypothetical protein